MADQREFIKNRAVGLSYCNKHLKKDVCPQRDLVLLSKPIWHYLKETYGGDEISRYSIYLNPSSTLDRSTRLPCVWVALIMKDEAIRTPKMISLPRKSQFRCLKAILRESTTALRDYCTEEHIRLWRLCPEAKDSDFISQYNEQLKTGELPELLKFPGVSLEDSFLENYIEEYYSLLDNERKAIFVEVNRPSRPHWVFAFDAEERNYFLKDPQADKAEQVYGISLAADYYSGYYKFRNCTENEYSKVARQAMQVRKEQDN